MQSTTPKSAGIGNKTGILSRPDSESLLNRSTSPDWLRDGATGFSYRSLYEDTQMRQSTVLMKVDTGAVAAPHAHDRLEQVFVLEGDFYDQDHSYRPGDFIVRAPGAIHTGGSKFSYLQLGDDGLSQEVLCNS